MTFSLLLGLEVGGAVGPLPHTVVAPHDATQGVLVCGLDIGSPFYKSISVTSIRYTITPDTQEVSRVKVVLIV